MTNKYSYIYGSQTFRSLIKFSFIDIVKDSVVFIKTVIMLIFLQILIKHSQNYATRKNSGKLNFARKCQAS